MDHLQISLDDDSRECYPITMNEAELKEEIKLLREAIQNHRDKTGHELCWLNDLELWKVLGDTKYPHETLPVREEFLGQCARYYASRIKGTPYAEPQTKQTV